jgi:hypothetical protein
VGNVIGTLILALIFGPLGRWVVADPAPMSWWMVLAAGVGGVLLWSAIPASDDSNNAFVFTLLLILPPILAVGALVAAYRTITRPPGDARPQALGRRWLRRCALVSLALFPATYVVALTFETLAVCGVQGCGPTALPAGANGDALQVAGGVAFVALVLVLVRWGSSRWWERSRGSSERCT